MPNVGAITGSMYLDPSAYIAGLNQAATATRTYQQGVDRMTFAGFNRGVFATTTLLYGLSRIMSSMSQGMEEYTNMLGRIGSVADLTAASVGALADSMKKLSVAQGVSRKDLMGGMYTAAQSGFYTPAEMRAMATSGALLSRASGKEIDVKKGVDLMTVARQALGIGAGAISSNRMTNLLLKGRDVGRWELDEMAQALGIPLTVYGNQFSSKIGGEETLRQLVAIMSTATLAGLNPRMAATGTRRLVERTVQLNKTKLGDPLRQGLRGMGFGGGDPIGAAMDQGPMAYLNTLMQLTGGTTGELNRMGFGSRDLMVLTSAMRGKGETLNRLYGELDYRNTAGLTEKYNKKMQGTYDYTRDRLRSQWEITSQQFMQASIPLIGQFTNMLAGFNSVAQALPESVKSFMMLMAALTSMRLMMTLMGFRNVHVGGSGAAMAGGVAGGLGGRMMPTIGNRIFGGGGNVGKLRGPTGVNARFGGLPMVGANAGFPGVATMYPGFPKSAATLASGNIGAYLPSSGHMSGTPSSGKMNGGSPFSGIPFFTPMSGRMAGTPSSGYMSGTPASNLGFYTPTSVITPRALSSGNIGAYVPSSGRMSGTPSSNLGFYTPTSYRPLASGNIGAYLPSSGRMSGTPSTGKINGGSPFSGIPFFTPMSGRMAGTPSSGKMGAMVPDSFIAAGRSMRGGTGPMFSQIYPRGFGKLGGTSKTQYGYNMPGGNAFGGMGGTMGGAVGMTAGMALGTALEGENGSGLVPMAAGMMGGQLGSNVVQSYLAGGGGVSGVASRLMGTLRAFGPAAAIMLGGSKLLGGALWDAQTPMTRTEREDLEDQAALRKRSSFAPLRLMSDVWNSLPGLGQLIAEAPTAGSFGTRMSETWGAERFGRLWNRNASSKSGLFDEQIWNNLDKNSRGYLMRGKMADVKSLLKNEQFQTGFREQFGNDAWRQVSGDSLYKSDPQKWVGLLGDAIKILANSAESAKQKTEALAVAESKLAEARGMGSKDMRPYFAFSGGVETLLGLEGSQRQPFQSMPGADWQKQYSAALGIYDGIYGKGLPKFNDASLMAARDEFGTKLGKRDLKNATAPIDSVLDWNGRLRGMDFLAKNGPSLSDKTKLPDTTIINGLGLDWTNMGDPLTQSILGKIRNLDYTDWTQTFERPKAPFSQALQYGTKEGYNATLERKDDFVVTIMAPKLQAIVDTLLVTQDKMDAKQREFELALGSIIENATAPIVAAINNASGGGGDEYPPTDD